MKYPTVAVDGDTLAGDLFPSVVPSPEVLVYEHLQAATHWHLRFGEEVAVTLPHAFDRPPELSYFAHRDGPSIPVVRGWPAYPGKVPAIGVAGGNESADSQVAIESSGFAGDVAALDPSGNVVATASYFAYAIYSTVIVQLLHENRDERDRLHDELRRILAPLQRRLPGEEPRIKKVQVDAEKAEVDGGPPVAKDPFTVYLSIFTVHVWHEMLEAVDVTGPTGLIGAINLTIVPT